jgi:adenine-specific DNA-methyltransferase
MIALAWPGRGRPVVCDPTNGRWVVGPHPPLAETALPAARNLVLHADAFDALTRLGTSHGGAVRLIYIDPPFNTGNELLGYDDRTSHEIWLSAMEERLERARPLLVPGGFVVVHLNIVEQAYAKVLLDELFGRDGLVTQISWQRSPDRTLLGQGSALVADQVEYLLVYAPTGVPSGWPRPLRRTPLSDKTLRTYGRVLVPSECSTFVGEVAGARIFAHDGHRLEPVAPGDLGRFAERMRLTNQQPESTLQQALLGGMTEPGRLYRAEYVQARGKHRGPRVRYYLNGNVVLWLRDVAAIENGALVRVADWNNFWPADEVPATGIAREGGVTLRRGKKPEKLLERIVGAFSRPGELVLDFFAGSGTTGAVAARLGRRFILVEASAANVAMCRERLRRDGASFAEARLLP